VFPLLQAAIEPSDYPAMLRAETRPTQPLRGDDLLRDEPLTRCFRSTVEQMRGDLTVRLRPTRSPTPEDDDDMTPDNGDDMLRQVGIKIWVDGSPWIGNIDLSFPYLDTEATRIIGVAPGSCGCANYTRRAVGRDRRGVLPEGLADGMSRSGRRRDRHDPRRVRGRAA